MLTNLSRKNRFLVLLVGLLAFRAFFSDQPFSPTPVTASAPPGPPLTGDWVIVSDTVIRDEHYIVNGSIIIESGANLTLTNVTLWLNCAYDGQFNITVNSGGELYFHNCTVTAYNSRWFLAAKAGSTLLLNATTISYTGYDPDGTYDGVSIHTDNAKVINCTLLENYYGIKLYQANGTLIKDNNFTLSYSYAIYIENASNTILEANSITNGGDCAIYTYISQNTTIERSNITDIHLAGIWLQNSGNATIRGNMVTDCFWTDYGGIFLADSGNSTIHGNNVTNNYGRGILLKYSGNSTIHENTVTNSDESSGIELVSSGQSSIHGNNVTNTAAGSSTTGRGILLSNSGNSIVSGNAVTNTEGSGIGLYTSGNSTVSGNTITNSSDYSAYGILLAVSGDSTVYGNRVTNSSDSGMRLWDSSNSTVCENTITNSTLYGIDLGQSGQSTVNRNTVTNSGFEGIKLNDSAQATVSENTVMNTYGIRLGLCGQSTVSGNAVTNSWSGINLASSDQSIVSGNTVTNSTRQGIGMSGCDQSTASGNAVINSGTDGIGLWGFNLSTFSGNTVTNSGENGIKLQKSTQSTISGNTITNSSWDGIEVVSSAQSTISENTITNSSYYGISLGQSTSDCLLWGNILSTNEKGNAYDSNGANQWDNGTHGNWYDDYTGPDLNQDGIGDHPYSIGGGLVEDRYPLMNLALPDTNPPTVDSPVDVTYTVHSTGHTITWQPSDANPFWYQVFRNGVIIANTTWDGAVITLEIDNLEVGTYNYTIVVIDRLGYRTTDEVLVTVKPQEEETTEGEPQLIPGFGFPLVGVSFAVGWFLARLRRRKGKPGDNPKSRL